MNDEGTCGQGVHMAAAIQLWCLVHSQYILTTQYFCSQLVNS